MSPPNVTTYCACHAKWPSNIWQKTADTSFPMRGRSVLRLPRKWWHVPRPFPSVRNPPRNCAFRAPDERFVLKFRAPAIFPNLTKYLTLELHQVLRLPSDTWTSTAPTTKLESPVLRLPRKVTLELPSTAPAWHLTFTKYCACHTEWLAGLILVTYETSFPMRGATNVTLQTHHILRLPRKMTIQHLAEICGKQLKRHFQCAADPNMIRSRSETCSDHRFRQSATRHARQRFRQSATRHATEVTFRAPDERFVLKNTTFRAPAIFPNFTKYCAYHEKWHFNFTKYCAYHAKWHLNFTKYCAYHAKWHLTFTNYCAYHAKWHLNLTKYYAYHEKWHLISAIYYAAILLSDSLTLLLLSDLLLRDSINWLY